MKITVKKADVIWSFAGTILSMSIGVILLPMVLRQLTDDEVGVYYIFTSLSGITALFDFGFAPSVARSMAYAWSGAEVLIARGVEQSTNLEPNYFLMYRITKVCRLIYAIIAAFALVLFLVLGSAYIHTVTTELEGNNHMIAWYIYAIALVANLYYGYFTVFLRGVGAVAKANKAMVVSRSIQLVLAFVLLSIGTGLIGVSVAYCASSISYPLFAKFMFYKHEGIGEKLKRAKASKQKLDLKNLFDTIWPNTWRDGLVSVSNYLLGQATTIIASFAFTLYETGVYSLATQLIGLLGSVSTILYNTYVPSMQSAHQNCDREAQRKNISIGVVSFIVIYVVGMCFLVLCGNQIIRLIKPSYVLDISIVLVMGVSQFIQYFRNCYCSFLSSTNRLIYMRSFLISSLFSVIIGSVCSIVFKWGAYGLLLGQIMSQSVYNVWRWPLMVHKELELGIKDMFHLGINGILDFVRKPDKKQN